MADEPSFGEASQELECASEPREKIREEETQEEPEEEKAEQSS